MEDDDTPLYAPLAFLTGAQQHPRATSLYAQGYLGAEPPKCYTAAELAVQVARRDTKHLESLRREPRSVEHAPKQQAVTLDYANSGTQIDAAVAALDEALPGAQKERAEVAYALLSRGVQELGVWMRANGYDV